MSYQEAIEDRVPRKSLLNGMWAYLPPCHICGEPAYSWNYIRGNKYTCKACRQKKPVLSKKVCT